MHTAYHINSDPGRSLSKQQLDKYLKINFTSPSRNTDEKEKKKKKKCNRKAFCVARKRINVINNISLCFDNKFIT